MKTQDELNDDRIEDKPHDLFVTIDDMTPGEYKNGGEDLRINYSFAHYLNDMMQSVIP